MPCQRIARTIVMLDADSVDIFIVMVGPVGLKPIRV
jgi:hypothetical protein